MCRNLLSLVIFNWKNGESLSICFCLLKLSKQQNVNRNRGKSLKLWCWWHWLEVIMMFCPLFEPSDSVWMSLQVQALFWKLLFPFGWKALTLLQQHPQFLLSRSTRPLIFTLWALIWALISAIAVCFQRCNLSSTRTSRASNFFLVNPITNFLS